MLNMGGTNIFCNLKICQWLIPVLSWLIIKDGIVQRLKIKGIGFPYTYEECFQTFYPKSKTKRKVQLLNLGHSYWFRKESNLLICKIVQFRDSPQKHGKLKCWNYLKKAVYLEQKYLILNCTISDSDS